MINTGHIIRARYERDWSQRQLADRIECGKVNPRLGTILALCHALETEPNKVIKWD